MDIDLIDEFSNFESRLTKIEQEIKDKSSEKKVFSSFKREEYIYSEGKRYICIHFSQNKPCIKSNITRPAGFDICISDDGTICPMLLELE
ncbi:MAG TPA: hypothetical protein PLE45_10735 [Spirochaetota bacterium]|nr:hypothetical protein [Spirochaetota bacterium]HOL57646.1 hypothetical protein [Spirochaetota bacterium]HPP05200.1 hypothetical protein [Spirochaetota bacterium]